MLMILLGGFYVVLGCLLDGFSIVVMTLPIALPMVTAAGFDPIWFGIYLILMVEVSQITPPVGFNLFVIQGLTGEPIVQIARYALPFFFLDAVDHRDPDDFPGNRPVPSQPDDDQINRRREIGGLEFRTPLC